MVIRLQNVLPEPLNDIQHPEWSFWAHGNANLIGQNTYICAKSGKGKSTFLQMIFGLRKDYIGDIHFDGRNIRDISFDEWSAIRQTKLTMVFHETPL